MSDASVVSPGERSKGTSKSEGSKKKKSKKKKKKTRFSMLMSSFRLTSPVDSKKSIKYFHCNTTAIAAACITVFLLDALMEGASEGLAVRASPGPEALMQTITYWLVHRDLHHLTGNIALLLLLGPRVERLMSEYKFYFITLVSAFIGGICSVSVLSSGIQGTGGIVLCYSVIVLRYSAIEGVAKQTKRSLYRFPRELDVNLILVFLLCLARVFGETGVAKGEESAGYAHVITAMAGVYLMRFGFGGRKPTPKKKSWIGTTSSAEKESPGLFASFRQSMRRDDSDSEESEPEKRSSRLIKRIPGFRGKKKKPKFEYDSSDSEDAQSDRKSKKNLHDNIPAAKRKGLKRGGGYDSDSDYDD